jgi:hypothetical protein
MKLQAIKLKKTFMNVVAVFGAVYAGLVNEIDVLEEETWLGIG